VVNLRNLSLGLGVFEFLWDDDLVTLRKLTIEAGRR